jgi:hypothetical protein
MSLNACSFFSVLFESYFQPVGSSNHPSASHPAGLHYISTIPSLKFIFKIKSKKYIVKGSTKWASDK